MEPAGAAGPTKPCTAHTLKCRRRPLSSSRVELVSTWREEGCGGVSTSGGTIGGGTDRRRQQEQGGARGRMRLINPISLKLSPTGVVCTHGAILSAASCTSCSVTGRSVEPLIVTALFPSGQRANAAPGRLQCPCPAAHASGRPPPHAARASLPNTYTGLGERSGPLPPLQPPLASDGAAVRAQPPSSLEPPCREALAAQLLTGCACGRLQRPVQPGRRCRRSLQPPPPLDLAGGAGPWRQL